jgi:hypothetical protein
MCRALLSSIKKDINKSLQKSPKEQTTDMQKTQTNMQKTQETTTNIAKAAAVQSIQMR